MSRSALSHMLRRISGLIHSAPSDRIVSRTMPSAETTRMGRSEAYLATRRSMMVSAVVRIGVDDLQAFRFPLLVGALLCTVKNCHHLHAGHVLQVRSRLSSSVRARCLREATRCSLRSSGHAWMTLSPSGRASR